MLDFLEVKAALRQQFESMDKHALFVTDTDKDYMYQCYLGNFDPEDNPIFRKRTVHDCSCCRQFIRSCGNVVSIRDGELVSIWDINIGGGYQKVADAMAALVKGNKISNKYLHYTKVLGTNKNFEDDEGKVIEWNHFHHILDQSHIRASHKIDTELGLHRTSVETFKRALEEIELSAIEVVNDLIGQNSLYRGNEYKNIITAFMKCKKRYDTFTDKEKSLYIWNSNVPPSVLGIRNTMIGTLLVDISKGKDLTRAVNSFEGKADGYKRPTALITAGMIDKAMSSVAEKGLTESLKRRYAIAEDLNITNVIWANRDAKKTMDVFEEMKKDIAVDVSKFDKVEEMPIEAFISDVLPKADSIELMFDNKHSNNLVSLIAPVVPDSPSLMKWGNQFSWSYNGEMADSMRQQVIDKGGKVDGVLRYSIRWNKEGHNNIDFDAHCAEPGGNLISYPKAGRAQPSSGKLDVDVVDPGGKIAVENIIWTAISKMRPGKYQMILHNYSSCMSTAGFEAEIECGGIIRSYNYNRKVGGKQKVPVATVHYDILNGFKVEDLLESSVSSKELWNISTQQFHKVSMVMNSPNHWDGENIGNKHWFFMLTDCKNEDNSRGFYNEFLRSDLDEIRKVFEVLGSKMKTELSDNQLSGLGFSSTKRDSVLCKVTGSFTRVIKINF